jgi:hypothetical protein
MRRSGLWAYVLGIAGDAVPVTIQVAGQTSGVVTMAIR